MSSILCSRWTRSVSISLNFSIWISQALVDAPDMVRSQLNFKRLTLTDIKIDIKRVPNKKTLVTALEAAGRYQYHIG